MLRMCRLIVSMSFVVVLLAVLLAGCKKKQDDTSASAQSSPQAAASALPPEGAPLVDTGGLPAGTEGLQAAVLRIGGQVGVKKADDGRWYQSIDFYEKGPADSDLEQLAPLMRNSPLPIGLNLSRQKITDAGVAHLKGCGAIQFLYLSDTRVSDAGLKDVGELAQLEALYLSNDKLTDAGIAHLAKLTNLRKLSVYSKALTEAAYAHVDGMTLLEEIQLGGISGETSDGRLSHMKGMTHLKELRLTGDQLTDAGMAYVKNLTGVRKVWMEAAKVTKAGAANLGALKNLEELTVLKCPGLDDDGLEVLKDMKSLKTLDLIYTGEITHKGSAALATLTGLTKLRLGSIGEGGLEGLKNLANLEDLDLNFSRVDDANLAYLSGLTHLKKLDIQDTAVTDAGMKSLSGLTGLRKLVCQSNKITDAGLKPLASLTGLEELWLTNCKITGSVFKDMRPMTALKVLFLGGNPVANENALALKDLTGLREVALTGTQVSEEVALQLKQLRPDMTVRDVTGNEVSLTAKAPEQHRSPVEDLSHTPPDFTMTALAFAKEFKDSEIDAKTKYKGKVIELSGEVGRVDRNFSGDTYVSLVGGDLVGVMCFTAEDEPWAKAVSGQKVKMKGRLGDFGAVLTSCVFTDAGTFGGIYITAEDLAKEFAADAEATGKKYKEKYLVLTGEVEKKEYNSAGAVGIVMKTPGAVKVGISFTAFENDLARSIKPGQKIKVIGQYTFNFGTDKVELYFCLPIRQQ